jgi:hypothetical protein
MTSECLFNSLVLRNIFDKKPLSVKADRDVIASHRAVTAITEMATATGGGPW